MVEDDAGCSWTPLMYAVKKPIMRKDIIKLLLKHGAKVRGLYNSDGEDVLLVANENHPSLVPLLKEAGKKEQ